MAGTLGMLRKGRDGKGVYVKQIHCIAADPLVPESVEHRGLVHYGDPRRVNQPGLALHQPEGIGVDEQLDAAAISRKSKGHEL